MASACRLRLAVAGPSLALAALVAVGPSAYAVVDQPPRTSAPHARSTRPDDPGTGAGAGDAGLAGTRAGEGRPHPGRDADSPELHSSAGGQVNGGRQIGTLRRQRPAADPDDAADSDDAGALDDAAASDDAAAPAAAPQQARPAHTGRAHNGPAHHRTAHHRRPETSPAQAAGDPAIPPAQAAGSAAPSPGAGAGATAPAWGAVPAPSTTVGQERTGHGPGERPGKESGQESRQAAESPSGRAFEVLPLGTGLALVGLGIGVIAVRLRRD